MIATSSPGDWWTLQGVQRQFHSFFRTDILFSRHPRKGDLAMIVRRLFVATVILFSLLTPICWMVIGSHSKQAQEGSGKVAIEEASSSLNLDVTGISGIHREGRSVLQSEGSNLGSVAPIGKDESAGLKASDGGPDIGPATITEQSRAIDKEQVKVEPTSKVTKIEFLSGAMRDQLVSARELMTLAQEKDNKQLARHYSTGIDRAQAILDKLDNDKIWVGDEVATGVIKLLEALNARAREWKSTIQLIKRLQRDLAAAKEKINKVTRERNLLDLAAAKALPKSLHCFGMKLTMAHSNNPEVKVSQKKRLEDQRAALVNPKLYHYAIFSDNVLAASVVVNSTIMNARKPHRHVFHLVTDSMNKGAMEAWFALHPPGAAALEIQAVEEYTWLNASYVPVLKQLSSDHMKTYYFGHVSNKENGAPNSTLADRMEDIGGHKQPKYRNPKYLSMLNHLRFYLPEVYPALNKILFLDDDVVVQKDLTPLFRQDLKGNVNGAVFTCKGEFHRLHRYLNFSNPYIKDRFDPQGCGWAYGMNVFDLKMWRNKELTKVYHEYQTRNEDRSLWLLGTLPPGLMTFYNLTLGLDPQWHVLGLGYNEAIPIPDVEGAAVVHWNGNQKPWLDIAMKHFKPFWAKYVALGDEVVQSCNINIQ